MGLNTSCLGREGTRGSRELTGLYGATQTIKNGGGKSMCNHIPNKLEKEKTPI